MKNEFVDRKKEKVEKVLPFDMLVVPHGMSTITKSENHAKYNNRTMHEWKRDKCTKN